MRRWEEREGPIDGVFTRWVVGGCDHPYMAIPPWKIELDELGEKVGGSGSTALRWSS